MRLRVWTTVLFVFGLLMLAAWPWLVGAPPGKQAPRPDQVRFAIRSAVYVAALLITFFVTALMAWLTARQERRRYREEAMENVRDLIEGTLKDHERKRR